MNDMDKIRYILQDYFESSLPPLIEREFPYSFLDSNLIISVVGVRRSGKTYLLYQLINRLKKTVPFQVPDCFPQRSLLLSGEEL